MHPKSIAGATALLAAPILVIAGALAQPTLSGDAAKQVVALTSHRGAMIAGMTLSMIAAVLLIGGTVWLALTLAPCAPRLAMAGGVLGVLGSLIVLFENSVGAAAPAIVAGLDRAQADSRARPHPIERRHLGVRAGIDCRQHRRRPARDRRRQGRRAPLGRGTDRHRRARLWTRFRDRLEDAGAHLLCALCSPAWRQPYARWPRAPGLRSRCSPPTARLSPEPSRCGPMSHGDLIPGNVLVRQPGTYPDGSSRLRSCTRHTAMITRRLRSRAPIP